MSRFSYGRLDQSEFKAAERQAAIGKKKRKAIGQRISA
jgi:hypothetical protein